MAAKWMLSIFVAGGLFFLGLGVWKTWQMSRQLAQARQTKAQVLSSRVEETGDGRNHYYVPVIRYRYQIGGRTYTSSNVYPGGAFVHGSAELSRGIAEGIVRQHAEGTEAAIWYLPREPETSFLVRRRRGEFGSLALLGGVHTAIGAPFLLAMMVYAPRVRLWLASSALVAALALVYLLWTAFVTAPRAELIGSPLLGNKWFIAAFLVICWSGFVAFLPPQFDGVRRTTIAAVGFATFLTVLSLFVFVPLAIFAPDLAAHRALPWVWIGCAALGLIGWISGFVTVDKPSRPHE